MWSDMGRYLGNYQWVQTWIWRNEVGSGDRYVGNWSHDKQYGEGTYYFSSDYGPDKRYQAYEYLPPCPHVTAGDDTESLTASHGRRVG